MRLKMLMVWGIGILFAVALTAGQLSEKVTQVFKTGQVELLAETLADKVIFIQLNVRNDLSSSECRKKLSAFFTAHKPEDFKILHQSTQGETGFVIGKLTTASGVYRIHCLFKTEEGTCRINQIRIDTFHE